MSPSPASLRDYAGRSLTWRRQSLFGRRWVLEADQQQLATLHWPSAFRSEAMAETPDGSWRFQRRGVFRPVVHVIDAAHGVQVTTMRRRLGGEGRLEGPGLRRCRWGKENFWGRIWTWRGEDGAALATFVNGGFRPRFVVDPERRAGRYQELPLLLTLGCYLRVTDQAAAAAAS